MPGVPSSAFGSLLKEYRLAAGLTQESLAGRAGLGVRSIQALERGGSRPLRETLRRLAAALALEAGEQARLIAAGAPVPRGPARRAVAAVHRPPRSDLSPRDSRVDWRHPGQLL